MTLFAPSVTPSRPLLKELCWLVQLRWLAGSIAIIGILLLGLWSGLDGHSTRALLLSLAVLVYNLPFWLLLRSPHRANSSERFLLTLAWLQIGLDLVCLTIITHWTGGVASPFRGFFILHMVLASLLLSPSNSYLAAALAMAMVVTGLAITDQWPQREQEFIVLGGWAAVLLLTVFLVSHITVDWRRQHVAARDRLHRLRAILDTAAEGIITINDRGIIESTNKAADRIFGYEPGEVVGRNVNMLMPEPYHSQHDTYISSFLRTRQAKIIGIGREVMGLRKDGSVFPLDLAVSEVVLHGRTMFTGILRDITQRKAAEEELVTLNKNLQRHQQALIQQEKMAAMGQMAAGVVHEISNPLASMDSVLQLVQRHPDRFDDQTVQNLQEQIRRIHRITRQLTDFAHPNETGWEVRPVNDIVQGALDMVRFDHRIRNVEVVCEPDPNAGNVRAMVPALQQVLLNMILNALDAMSGRESPRLVIATQPNGRCTCIQISDNGSGIEAEHLSRVFEPFFTTKPLGRGTGLGLSISYNLIQRHGGRCEVDSDVTPGKAGTTFRIFLPSVETERAERD